MLIIIWIDNSARGAVLYHARGFVTRSRASNAVQIGGRTRWPRVITRQKAELPGGVDPRMDV